ncbi:unnamed protein product, partial [Sphagnum compactum]
MTPFEKQYWEIKKDLFDTIVFFKKGKFYEVYEGDADIASKQFDLKLTDRVNMRMAGVPEATLETWCRRFVGAGYRVAIVEQADNSISLGLRKKGLLPSDTTQPKTTGSIHKSSIIERRVSSVLTAATLVDPVLMASDLSTFCMAIKEIENSFGVAFVDTSTAEFFVCHPPNKEILETILVQTRPREILLEKGGGYQAVTLCRQIIPNSSILWLAPEIEFWGIEKCRKELLNYFEENQNLPNVLQKCNDIVIAALGGLISYLRSV